MASSVDLFGRYANRRGSCRSSRDGGANVVLYKSLKTFMTIDVRATR